MRMRLYKPLHEYFLIIKYGINFYRLIKFEQGKDKSFYVKWNFSNQNGAIIYGNYWSYHYNFDNEHGGYRVHCYGCSGERFTESIEYREKFISEYSNYFFKFGMNGFSENEIIIAPDEKDIVFDIGNENIEKYDIILFSPKRTDLLQKDYDNMVSKIINLDGYNLIVSLFKKS